MNAPSSREAIGARTRNALKLSVPDARVAKDEDDHMASCKLFNKQTGSVIEWWAATPEEIPPLKIVKNEDEELDGDVSPLDLSPPVEIPATPPPPVSENLSPQLKSAESRTISSAMTAIFTPTRTPSTAQTTPASSNSKRTETEPQAKSGPDSIRQVHYISEGRMNGSRETFNGSVFGFELAPQVNPAVTAARDRRVSGQEAWPAASDRVRKRKTLVYSATHVKRPLKSSFVGRG